ncbi:MAG: NifU family protein [Halanaerobiales bacterium]
MIEEIEKFIKENIRPVLQQHGGDIEISELDQDKLYLNLKGECRHCPAANETIENFIKKRIFNCFKEIEKVKVESHVSPDLLKQAQKILQKKGCNLS